MITVYMAGLIYHHGCTTDAKRALVPDGTMFRPRHYASLFIEADRIKRYDWWRGQKKVHDLTFVEHGQTIKERVIEFRIPTRSEITFPDDDNDPAKFLNLENGLPQIQSENKSSKFEIDLDYPETIAEVPIRGGELSAYKFHHTGEQGAVAIVQWMIMNDANEIAINVRSLHDNKTLILKSHKLEIVFSNTSDLISSGHRAKDDVSHFMLYDKLNKNRPGGKLKDPGPSTLEQLVPNHAYLKYLAQKEHPLLGGPGCTPTCC
jgi:hypothetical protein